MKAVNIPAVFASRWEMWNRGAPAAGPSAHPRHDHVTPYTPAEATPSEATSPGREPCETLHQRLVNLPIPRHREVRQFGQPHPPPCVELRMRIQIQPDIAVLSGKSQREPALPLPAKPALQCDTDQFRRQIV